MFPYRNKTNERKSNRRLDITSEMEGRYCTIAIDNTVNL